MNKKGFTLIEVVVSFAIFLVAFIPISQLTRNSTRLLNREARVVLGENSGNNSGEGEEDYSGHILNDFIKQVERRGYDYISKDNKILSTGKTYTLKIVSGQTTQGCGIGQYYLMPADSTDTFHKDPHDESKSKCFTQDTSEGGNFDNATIQIKGEKGTIHNLRGISAYENNKFIFVEAELQPPNGGLKEKSDTVLTKLEEFLN